MAMIALVMVFMIPSGLSVLRIRNVIRMDRFIGRPPRWMQGKWGAPVRKRTRYRKAGLKA